MEDVTVASSQARVRLSLADWLRVLAFVVVLGLGVYALLFKAVWALVTIFMMAYSLRVVIDVMSRQYWSLVFALWVVGVGASYFVVGPTATLWVTGGMLVAEGGFRNVGALLQQRRKRLHAGVNGGALR